MRSKSERVKALKQFHERDYVLVSTCVGISSYSLDGIELSKGTGSLGV